MKTISLLIGVSCLTALAGCSPAVLLKTKPVKVNTPKGQVICQLYSKQMVAWDISTDRPENMSKMEADEYCRQIGRHQLENG